MTDDDIGICDDCGSEDGERTPVATWVTVEGERTLVRVWMCESCAESRTTASNPFDAFLKACVEDSINGGAA